MVTLDVGGESLPSVVGSNFEALKDERVLRRIEGEDALAGSESCNGIVGETNGVSASDLFGKIAIVVGKVVAAVVVGCEEPEVVLDMRVGEATAEKTDGKLRAESRWIVAVSVNYPGTMTGVLDDCEAGKSYKSSTSLLGKMILRDAGFEVED